MQIEWQPQFNGTGDPIYVQIVESLQRDRENGRLSAGERLPTQRDLAKTLGIGIGTVTRAFAEAERRGLINSHVGRGAFVSGAHEIEDSSDAWSGPIDLSLNTPPTQTARQRISLEMAALVNDPELLSLLGMVPTAGLDRHRKVLAGWVRDRHGIAGTHWEQLLVTTGAQHALSLALRSTRSGSEPVLVEETTFFGFRAAAEQLGIPLVPIAMDRDGAFPAALADAARRSGAKVVYLQPTLHNPTTRIMPTARRAAIADVLRDRNLTLIEGDVYGALARYDAGGRMPDPIANLVPERTWFVSGLSKSIAPGLRVGMLLAPDAAGIERAAAHFRADSYSAGAIGPAIGVRMIENGSAIRLLDDIVRHASARTTLACDLLSPWIEKPRTLATLHVWLPRPELEAERLYSHAMREGILLTPPAALSTADGSPTGIRLCLNGPRSMTALEHALGVITQALRTTPTSATRNIV